MNFRLTFLGGGPELETFAQLFYCTCLERFSVVEKSHPTDQNLGLTQFSSFITAPPLPPAGTEGLWGNQLVGVPHLITKWDWNMFCLNVLYGYLLAAEDRGETHRSFGSHGRACVSWLIQTHFPVLILFLSISSCPPQFFCPSWCPSAWFKAHRSFSPRLLPFFFACLWTFPVSLS